MSNKVKFGSLKVGESFINPSHYMLSTETWTKRKPYTVRFEQVVPARPANCDHDIDHDIWFDNLDDSHEVIKV